MLAALALTLTIQQFQRETRNLEGWTVNVRVELLKENKERTEKALDIMTKQFQEIKRVVPADKVKWLQKVPIWVSPEYPKIYPAAAYHPGAEWLRQNGRDPIMAKGIEVANTSIFEPECKRMPIFMLHELAHSYHDQVLGFDEKRIKTAYEHAKASGKYDNVEKWDGKRAKAYAMTNQMEYFAEGTESFFGQNDFYPFNRTQLKEMDPELYDIMMDVWFKRK